MKFWQITLLVFYSLGLALGQILFKHAALGLKNRGGLSVAAAAVGNLSLWAALVLYAGLTALWVFILTFTPLSRAYPFIALTFVVTPLLGSRIFDEPVGWGFYLGLGATLVGLGIIMFESARP